MKIIKLVFVGVLVLLSFNLVACNSDGFTSVKSVTFTSGGTTQTMYSQWAMTFEKEFSSWEKTTESLYNSVDSKYKNTTTLSAHFVSGNMPSVSSGFYYPFGLSASDVGEYYYVMVHDLGYFNKEYYRSKIVSFSNSVLEIKVVSSTNIILRKGGKEWNYTVTSYSMSK